MAKISLNKLDLNKVTKVNKIKINEQEVEVLSYLPIREKCDIINIATRESFVQKHVNPLLLQAYFYVYVVISYTNISLTPTQLDDLLKTYDLLEKNDIITQVISAIPEDEYNDLIDGLYEYVEKVEKEALSISSLVEAGIEKIEKSLSKTASDLENIDLNSENLKNVLAIAKDNGALS